MLNVFHHVIRAATRATTSNTVCDALSDWWFQLYDKRIGVGTNALLFTVALSDPCHFEVSPMNFIMLGMTFTFKIARDPYATGFV